MVHLATFLINLNVFACVSADPTFADSQKGLLSSSSDIPATVVLNGAALVDAKARLREADHELGIALEHLTAQADYWLNNGPWSVTTKKALPQGGSVHDYTSQAPYWWLDPKSTEGCQCHKCDSGRKCDFGEGEERVWKCDGRRNPEVDSFPDHTNRGYMFNSSYVLALAWYYTGKPQYAIHAGDILRTWFLNNSTSMTPNLEYAQIVPCQNKGKGRSIGIIDFSQEYTNVLDAAAILALDAPGWNKSDKQGFTHWNSQFLDWLGHSKFGKTEANATNNHGTFANMQIAALALFVGNKTLAIQTVQRARSIIDFQILANGTQWLEVSRTRSWHYSNFNLGAHLRFALIAQKLGLDLYKYIGPKGQTLFGATDFMIPSAVNGQSFWKYPELKFVQYAATDNIRAAADAGDEEAKGVVGKLQLPPSDTYVLRPAPGQLDTLSDDDD